MLCLTCTMISSTDLTHYGISRAKDWVSMDYGTNTLIVLNFIQYKHKLFNKLLLFLSFNEVFANFVQLN